MEKIFSGLKDAFTDPLAALSPLPDSIRDKGHHVLDLMKVHPWATLGIATGTALIWSNLRSPWNLPPGEKMIVDNCFFLSEKHARLY